MGLNETASAERVHIGFFGMRNAGKSSLVNAFTNQELSVVSEVKGTTTDPVKKAMEILPIGPVVIVDTPGLDDEGELGNKRVERAKDVLKTIDIAILVVDSSVGVSAEDKELISTIKERKLPYILAFSKADLIDADKRIELEEALKNEPSIAKEESSKTSGNIAFVSSKIGTGVEELRKMVAGLFEVSKEPKFILKDLVKAKDVVVLVIPIDESAPKGRLILPQQLVLRELLDINAIPVCVQVEELEDALNMLGEKVSLVITDSQAFGKVSKIVPKEIYLTSFSILMARYKGELDWQLKGAEALDGLKDKESIKILIAEGCTHHRQCNDIGTVKLPKWIKEYTNSAVEFEFSSGNGFPKNLIEYDLIVHCGGCMITENELKNRVFEAKKQEVPIVNYGMAIAKMNGILDRSMEVFYGK